MLLVILPMVIQTVQMIQTILVVSGIVPKILQVILMTLPIIKTIIMMIPCHHYRQPQRHDRRAG